MALLMITHDLGVVANVADDVVVMYRGKVVESGNLADIFRDPRHDYLKALLHAVPRFDMKPGERLDLRALMEGKASDPMQWPEPFKDDGRTPLFWTEAEPGHYVRIAREGE